MLNKDSLKYKCNLNLLLAAAFLIPLHKFALSPVIGLLVLASFWNFKREKFSLVYLTSSLSYFAVLCIGYLISISKENALFELEISAAFLIFPVIFSLSNINFKEVLHRLILFFIEGLVLSILIAFVFSIVKYFHSQDINSFLYGEISPFHHTSYMAMFCSFAIAYLYYNSFNPLKKTYLSPKIQVLIIALLSIYVVLLLSKTGIIITFLIHLISITYWIFRLKKVKAGLLIMGIIFTTIILLFSTSQTIRNRFLETYNVITNENEAESSTSIRFITWESSWDIFMENPLIGAGTGDIQYKLSTKFIEKGHNNLAMKSYNAHNQFLNTASKSGILGLISILILFGVPIFYSLKLSNPIYIFFFLIVTINFMTESVLQTQSGIIFCAFFNSLLFISMIQKSELPTKESTA